MKASEARKLTNQKNETKLDLSGYYSRIEIAAGMGLNFTKVRLINHQNILTVTDALVREGYIITKLSDDYIRIGW